MNRLHLGLIAAGLALAFGAQAQTTPAKRIEARFDNFAGSNANASSLVTGLRAGKPVTLVGSGETVTFTSPTKPMGYGNVTRALDLARRELAASGIADPTPKEIQAALMGGTVAGPKGPVTYQGVLQLRAEGMGWGQIAHAIGVHPGLGGPVAQSSAAPTAGQSGIVTAAGGSPFSHGNGSSAAAGGHAGASQSTGAGNGKALGHIK